MSNTTNQRFAELEYGLQKYFDGKVASVMNGVRNDLAEKQFQEVKDHHHSVGGILSMGTMDKSGDTTLVTLKHVGDWNSKTVEDYVAMCQQKLHNDKGFQKDLCTLATEWRNAVVQKIGREKYDNLSSQLGCDLAYAYVGTRMDDLMMQKLVKDKMPKSTAEYVIRKATQGSLWGLEQELTKSPLAREIEEKGEKAFRPSKTAKMAGKVGAPIIDAATMGIGSWKSFAIYVGGDLLINSMFKDASKSEQKEQLMESSISKGVFGRDTNVFTEFRQARTKHLNKDNAYLTSLNSQLNNKIAVPRKPFMSFNIYEQANNTWQPKQIPGQQSMTERTSEKYKDVPLIVAAGKEEEYLADKAKRETAQHAEKKEKPDIQYQTASVSDESSSAPAESQPEEQPSPQQTQAETTDNSISTTASNGWEQLLQATGMKGIGTTAANLGYVISMLPDVLLGMFNGKTKSMGFNNTVMPIASILLGLFVKNPMLKLMLIGMGGANLINKVGKESMGVREQEEQRSKALAQNGSARYRQYDDEQLNPRITNPTLQGATLIANIDRVPYSIQLTENVVAAHKAGALPLNTLANAVLSKYDAQQAAARQYGQMIEQHEQQTETIHRIR